MRAGGDVTETRILAWPSFAMLPSGVAACEDPRVVRGAGCDALELRTAGVSDCHESTSSRPADGCRWREIIEVAHDEAQACEPGSPTRRLFATSGGGPTPETRNGDPSNDDPRQREVGAVRAQARRDSHAQILRRGDGGHDARIGCARVGGSKVCFCFAPRATRGSPTSGCVVDAGQTLFLGYANSDILRARPRSERREPRMRIDRGGSESQRHERC